VVANDLIVGEAEPFKKEVGDIITSLRHFSLAVPDTRSIVKPLETLFGSLTALVSTAIISLPSF
jgi:hypothetical protein